MKTINLKPPKWTHDLNYPSGKYFVVLDEQNKGWMSELSASSLSAALDSFLNGITSNSRDGRCFNGLIELWDNETLIECGYWIAVINKGRIQMSALNVLTDARARWISQYQDFPDVFDASELLPLLFR